MSERVGKVVQVIGPVVDIKFDTDALPNIYNEIRIDMGENQQTNVAKKIVKSILGESGVKTIKKIINK